MIHGEVVWKPQTDFLEKTTWQDFKKNSSQTLNRPVSIRLIMKYQTESSQATSEKKKFWPSWLVENIVQPDLKLPNQVFTGPIIENEKKIQPHHLHNI